MSRSYFKVKVAKVNTIKLQGQASQIWRFEGYTSGMEKGYCDF
jgi:ribosomal protein L23